MPLGEDDQGGVSRTAGSRASKFAPSRRAAEPSANGLPVFCRSRHYVRGANVYSVPLWDFTSRWLPEELKAYASTASSASSARPKAADPGQGPAVATIVYPSGAQETVYANRKAAASADNEDNKKKGNGNDADADEVARTLPGQNGDDEASDSEQSEIGWEGQLGDASRNWSRAAVETALVLLRRMQVPGPASAEGEGEEPAAPITYGLGVSSALFPPEIIAEGNDASLDRRLAQILRTREPKWAVCALRSGHFAGAVFQAQEPIVHKAIHRYTVRAKAGGAQSSCDGGKSVKSVGSSLRRYGETRLAEEIKELMTDKWADELASCELIFVSVSNRMKSTLLGTEKEPFLPEASHAKVRKLPFMVGKPTFEAVKEAYLKVASVTFAEEKRIDALCERFRPAAEKAKPSSETKATPAPKKEAAPKPKEEPVVRPKYSEEEDELFTKLHRAAFADDENLIMELLDDGADPRARDGKGRVPYYLCSTQKAREAFRKWRGANEEAWDWEAAQVPAGINDQTLQNKKDKEKEKKKRQKEKQKAAKAEQAAEEVSDSDIELPDRPFVKLDLMLIGWVVLLVKLAVLTFADLDELGSVFASR
eukprot:TRINITY_DN10319_c0_g1_i6.p1 TRINITY_DN10319_c0_g1~~TRINITY_DN10319_c0_g1_i6.p1  ORF type:complete len:595 (-),score=156.23 TRINITY_DN10319_c0_g1_i6:47-1831(-)